MGWEFKFNLFSLGFSVVKLCRMTSFLQYLLLNQTKTFFSLFSFSVLFPNYKSFNANAVSAVVKSLVMMAGEIEYEDFIYENGDTLFPITGHFMILLFVVLISIILMNLLVGLAVSDIQVNIINEYNTMWLYIIFLIMGIPLSIP